MIDVSSGRPSARSPVRHSTVTSRVMSVPELVMNALVPLMTHSSPSRTARVRGLPASEPPPGSVSPNAASASPLHSRGSHSRFCSSLPNRKTGIEPSPTAGLERDRDAAVGPGQLLDRQAQREEVAAHAAVLLGERQAEQPHPRPSAR